MGLKYKRTNIAPETIISIPSSAPVHESIALGPESKTNITARMFKKRYAGFAMLLNL